MDEKQLGRIEGLLKELLAEAQKIDPNLRGNQGDTHVLRESLIGFCHVAMEKCRQVNRRPRAVREMLDRVCLSLAILCGRIKRRAR